MKIWEIFSSPKIALRVRRFEAREGVGIKARSFKKDQSNVDLKKIFAEFEGS